MNEEMKALDPWEHQSVFVCLCQMGDSGTDRR